MKERIRNFIIDHPVDGKYIAVVIAPLVFIFLLQVLGAIQYRGDFLFKVILTVMELTGTLIWSLAAGYGAGRLYEHWMEVNAGIKDDEPLYARIIED